MATDPLSEARDALDKIVMIGGIEERVIARDALARLDAPAPEGGVDAGFVEIARCPEHGLHGDRHDCYVCGGPVKRVRMRPVEGGMDA